MTDRQQAVAITLVKLLVFAGSAPGQPSGHGHNSEVAQPQDSSEGTTRAATESMVWQAEHDEQGQQGQQAQQAQQAASVTELVDDQLDSMDLDDQPDLHRERHAAGSADDAVSVTGSEEEGPDSSQELGISPNPQVFGQRAQHEQQAEQGAAGMLF